MQFESNMTLTGANSDHRLACTPSDQKNIIAYLYDLLSESGSSTNLPENLKNATEKPQNNC